MATAGFFQNPTDRGLTRSERWVWIGGFGLWFWGDLFTTILGMSMGLVEGNLYLLVVAYLLDLNVVFALVVSKLVVLAGSGLAFSVLACRFRILIPLVYVGIGLIAVTRNVWMITTLGL